MPSTSDVVDVSSPLLLEPLLVAVGAPAEAAADPRPADETRLEGALSSPPPPPPLLLPTTPPSRLDTVVRFRLIPNVVLVFGVVVFVVASSMSDLLK